MAIQFTEDLLINHKGLDDHHREIYIQVKQVLSAYAQGNGEFAALNLMSFLERHVAKHFAEEEALMKLYKYQNLQQHQDKHNQFLRALRDLRAEYTETGPSMHFLVQFNQLIMDGLVLHIGREDKQLGAFLKNNPDYISQQKRAS